MMEALLQLDEKLLLLINGMHNESLDFFFYWMSEKWVWIPLYVLVFYFFYRAYPKKIVYVMLAATLLVLMTDQTASRLLKNLVMRVRPCHEPGLADRIHLVHGYCGGAYGFVSSHAANTFGLALFFVYTLGRRFPWMAGFLVGWALLVGFSRIYMGV